MPRKTSNDTIVKKSKPKRYCIRIDVGTDPQTGNRIRKTFYGHTKREAREKAEAFRAANRDGVDLVQAENTLANWIDRWFAVYGQRAGWSRNKQVEIDCELLKSALGNMPLKSIRPIHLQEYADARSVCAASTVSKTRGTVVRIFRDAVANRVLTFDPSEGVRWSSAGSGTHRMLDKWEIALITRYWDAHRTGIWAMLMLYAGLRRGEVLALTWADIDWQHNVIHVRRALHFEHGQPVIGATKTANSVRDVPMFPVLRRALQSVERKGEYICHSASGSVVTDRAWAAAWRTYNRTMTNALNGDTASLVCPGRRSDLDGANGKIRMEFSARAHDLRHTYCSLLHAAGVDVLTAQRLMGHASPDITLRIYTHLSDEMQADDVAKAIDYIDNLGRNLDAHFDAHLRNNAPKCAQIDPKSLNNMTRLAK